MGLRQLSIFFLFQSEYDVYRRKILTIKFGPRAEKVPIYP